MIEKSNTPYKNLSLHLKHKYLAKARMLDAYKTLLQILMDSKVYDKDGHLRPLSEQEVILRNLNKKDLEYQIRYVSTELRSIHLVRAFIKGISYKSIEPQCEISAHNTYYAEVLMDGLSDVYKLKDQEIMWNVIDEFMEWYSEGKASKFFAKPVKEVGYDANGAPTQ